MKDTFDYIIVGGGSAGCVTAARLVADFGARVLLLEAGGRDNHPLMKMPAAFVKLLDGGRYVTRHETTVQDQLGGRRHIIPQAKVLGGGSTVNGMVYMRGRPSDYDEWAAVTGENTGWGYREILPHFRKQEDNNRFFNDAHGHGGPLKVSDVRYTCDTSRIFVKSLQGMGFPYNPDFNSGEQRGVGWMQTTINNGKRSNATAAFLSSVEGDKRLVVRTNAKVMGLIFEGSRAVGVEYEGSSGKATAYASAEIIMASGAYVTPKLLMLSGIGPAEQLRQHGINVRVDSPGVGNNLQDHHEVPLISQALPGFGYHHDDTGLKMLFNGLQYLLFGTGPVNSIGCDVCAYVDPERAPNDQAGREPTLQFYCIPAVYLDRDVAPLPDVPGVTLHSCLARPKARGSVQLRSADPKDLPLVNPNYLGHADDMRISVAGLRFAREVFKAAPMSEIVTRELLPGPDVTSDEALAAHCRRTVKTNYHPVGTCRMGRADDPMAVLTPDLKVKGVDGLRVFDASFFPNLVCGNTNAPVMAAADRAVDIMMGQL